MVDAKTEEEIEAAIVEKLTAAIYPVLIPVEQQDCAVQAKNHKRITEISRAVWRAFTPRR